MYKIEKHRVGYFLTFSDYLSVPDAHNWFHKSKSILEHDNPSEFGVIVDMRTLQLIPREARRILIKGQKYFQNKGLVRSAVILKDSVTKYQFIKIAQESGIWEGERYIDASIIPNWNSAALQWVEDGIDPDNKEKN